MSTELGFCPFCGGRLQLFSRYGWPDNPDVFHWQCAECLVTSQPYSDREMAVKTANQRAQEDKSDG